LYNPLITKQACYTAEQNSKILLKAEHLLSKPAILRNVQPFLNLLSVTNKWAKHKKYHKQSFKNILQKKNFLVKEKQKYTIQKSLKNIL
jgi:hypothetical protein